LRTTVSDILLFQKCPYAWYIKNVNKREPITKSKALEHGLNVHGDFERFLKEGEVKVPSLNVLASSELKKVLDVFLEYDITAVEQPITVEISGHTIDGRPDGVLRHKVNEAECLWQLKTSSANKAHHIDIVRFSLHECIYGIGINYKKPVLTTILCRYITTVAGKVSVQIDRVTRSPGDIEAARQYVVRMCDQMEELTLGKRSEGWQAPPSCIDWITGQRCGYFNHCHHGVDLTDNTIFKPTEDRYAKEPPITGGS
jgi:hypothetical protein